MNLSDETALRLTEALEKLTQAIEMQGLPPLPGREHMSRDAVEAILGGPEALMAINKRRQAARRKARAK